MKIRLLIFIITLALLPCFSINPVQAGTPSTPTSTPTSTPPIPVIYEVSDDVDAIAIRVLPNPNHYNAIRWYKSQGFRGSPQSLVVDGYDAVRDGRSIYVNAANVASSTIHTNIYLMSYNQSSDSKTVDVLGQLVKNWRFNTNLTTPGECKISILPCGGDEDCQSAYQCISGDDIPGRCQLKATSSCYLDSDCDEGIYCNSDKAKVIRDVHRLGILGDLRESIGAYRREHGFYPVLSSGTYIPYYSVSTWPSWNDSFLSQIKAPQTSVDPINVLGPCAYNFDPITCWDKTSSAFAGLYNTTTRELHLPTSSHAFVYSTDQNGSNFNLCAGMETRNQYNTADGQLASSSCLVTGAAYTGTTTNQAPYIVSTNLRGQAEEVFNGSIMVRDPENNYLNWETVGQAPIYDTWHDSSAPRMQDTHDPNQKRIYSEKAGEAGNYDFKIQVSDSYGGVLATTTSINISNNPPVIKSNDVIYYPSTATNSPLIISFSATDSNYPLIDDFQEYEYNPGDDILGSSTLSTLTSTSTSRVGDTTYYTRKYEINTNNVFNVDKNFVYVIEVEDRYGAKSRRYINITIKADPPALDFNCNKNVRKGSEYYCGLGWDRQGGHQISYAASGSPAGISIVTSTNIYEPEPPNNATTKNNLWQKLKFFATRLKGVDQASASTTMPMYYAIKGTSSIGPHYNLIEVTATNEYGAVSTRKFTLNVNHYCGDGVMQNPNDERAGGLYNDGVESCDRTSGTTLSPASSTPTLQYKCSTVAETSFPIRTNDQCIFASIADGGGYCGDGFCTTPIEGDGKCPEDCL